MQHFDRRGQIEVALAKIDEAIAHTPTVIDLYSAKVCQVKSHIRMAIMIMHILVILIVCTIVPPKPQPSFHNYFDKHIYCLGYREGY